LPDAHGTSDLKRDPELRVQGSSRVEIMMRVRLEIAVVALYVDIPKIAPPISLLQVIDDAEVVVLVCREQHICLESNTFPALRPAYERQDVTARFQDEHTSVCGVARRLDSDMTGSDQSPSFEAVLEVIGENGWSARSAVSSCSRRLLGWSVGAGEKKTDSSKDVSKSHSSVVVWER